MKAAIILIHIMSVIYAQYSDLTIYEGEFGEWHPKINFPQNYYTCGVELRNQDYQGEGINDDTATNGVIMTLCNLYNWSDQQVTTIFEGIWGTWKGMKMCPEGTFVIGAVVQYFYTPDSNQDQSSINGLKITCGDFFTKENSIQLVVYEGPFGEFMNQVDVPLANGVCGTQVQNEAPIGSGDDTALNSIRFLICSACFHTCETCSGVLESDCVVCKEGLTRQPNGLCAQGCPPTYIDFNGICRKCDSACTTCVGVGPSKCNECSPGFLFNSELNLCYKSLCGAGQYFQNSTCVKCLPYCGDCSDPSTCSTCLAPFYLSTSKSSCLSSCEANEWADAQRVCHSCSVHCAKCVNQEHCSQCESDFILYDDSCVDPCEQNMDACSSNQHLPTEDDTNQQQSDRFEIRSFWSLLFVIFIAFQIVLQGFTLYYSQTHKVEQLLYKSPILDTPQKERVGSFSTRSAITLPRLSI